METTRMSLLLRIPEISRSHVKISDPGKVCDKLRRMHENGQDTIQTVFDFDQTLTKTKVNDERVMTSFEVILHVPEVPKSFASKGAAIVETHAKASGSTKLSLKEKLPQIEEQYKIIETIFQKVQLPISDSIPIEKAAKESNITLRDGVDKTFKILKDCSIPLTIISGGLTCVIDTILKDKGILYSNVNVIANNLEFSDNKLKGFSGCIINVINKNEFFMKDEVIIKEMIKRQNIIVVGDLISDANITEGVEETANVLKIAFYSGDQNDSSVEEFMKAFDIVICNDETMEVLNSILNYVTNTTE